MRGNCTPVGTQNTDYGLIAERAYTRPDQDDHVFTVEHRLM